MDKMYNDMLYVYLNIKIHQNKLHKIWYLKQNQW